MTIELINIKPTYMSDEELNSSDIYLQSVIFKQGKKYLIKANSGHGKTSILNIIYGNNPNFTGTVRYDEKTLSEKQLFELRKNKLSYVFQDLKLFEDLTAFENIILKNKLTNHKTIDEINEFINAVGLSHKKDSFVKTLSLGQRQRFAIIRALCQPFDFLLLDEPFSHLDDDNINILTELIGKELANKNAGLIMTDLGKDTHFQFDSILNL